MSVRNDFVGVVVVDDDLIGIFDLYDCVRACVTGLKFGWVGKYSYHYLLSDFVGCLCGDILGLVGGLGEAKEFVPDHL